MSNVIAFPQPAELQRDPAAPARSMTLFLHVKCATLIVHLANNRLPDARSERVSKS